MRLATLLADVLGEDLPIAVEAYDGSRLGPEDAPATLVINSPDALRRIITCPGELGFVRAYVSGDIDLRGDIFAVLDLRDRLPEVRLTPRQLVAAARLVGVRTLRPLPPPPEEARLSGRRHTRARDLAAVSHHYDVSNAFYELVLGLSMTYSCAYFEPPGVSLEEAQAAKHELVSRKLGLERGMRLLDVGCGWGGMVLHAALRHGVEALGVTLSRRQVERAEKRVAEAGLSHRVNIELRDYRDVTEGSFDAISSIGMFEHVGSANAPAYFGALRHALRPGGRLLNHAISRPRPDDGPRLGGRSFVDRYVFPDGELLEVGATVSAAQRAGFEVIHVESLRPHYARTLRAWTANLELHWDEAVTEIGERRARVWRLYMAASARNFEAGRTSVHQVLAVKTST